jgi:glyoxylase-like metal-dependent hydrolase (beta-lactamase superfamily II)
LRSRTLPPATHTNCVVAGGRFIIDPGTPDDDEIDRLIGEIDEKRIEGIILTHRHRDHIDGTELLRKELSGVPVYAHPITREEIKAKVRVDRTLDEGDTLPLGDGSALQVLFTPGHARGHICLWHAPTRAMVVGDMVAGVGSIVIAEPDGDVAAYLQSLERLRAMAPAELVPAHGPIIEDGVAKLTQYIEHRLAREAAVLKAIVSRPDGATLSEIVDEVYVGTPLLLLPMAAMAASTHVSKLVREGRVVKIGEQAWKSSK